MAWLGPKEGVDGEGAISSGMMENNNRRPGASLVLKNVNREHAEGKLRGYFIVSKNEINKAIRWEGILFWQVSNFGKNLGIQVGKDPIAGLIGVILLLHACSIFFLFVFWHMFCFHNLAAMEDLCGERAMRVQSRISEECECLQQMKLKSIAEFEMNQRDSQFQMEFLKWMEEQQVALVLERDCMKREVSKLRLEVERLQAVSICPVENPLGRDGLVFVGKV